MRLTKGTVLLNGVAVSEAAAIEFNPPPAAEWEPGALRAVARMKSGDTPLAGATVMLERDGRVRYLNIEPSDTPETVAQKISGAGLGFKARVCDGNVEVAQDPGPIESLIEAARHIRDVTGREAVSVEMHPETYRRLQEECAYAPPSHQPPVILPPPWPACALSRSPGSQQRWRRKQQRRGGR